THNNTLSLHDALPIWVDKMGKWFENGRFQRFLNMAQVHIETYTDTLRFIQSPPEDAVIIEIYPPTTLQSSALGSRLSALNHDYRSEEHTSELQSRFDL